MKIAIMQPYLFPYFGYFQLINAVDKFVIYDDVAFIKQGWINRNQVLVNGNKLMFSIPLENQSSFRLIRDTNINLGQYPRWRDKFLQTLTETYKKTLFFEVVHALVKSVLEIETNSISEICQRSLRAVCDYLQIETSFVETSIIYDNSHLKSQDRVIDICRYETATEYINPSGGIDLYSRDDFAEYGIDLKFIKSKEICYRQFKADFVPFLSVIDILMFNSVPDAQAMLLQYELI